MRTSPEASNQRGGLLGTGVTGKFTLPPAPITVVEVDDVGTGIVVVGDVGADGL